MVFNPGFLIKYILNLCHMLFHPANGTLKVISILYKVLWPYGDSTSVCVQSIDWVYMRKYSTQSLGIPPHFYLTRLACQCFQSTPIEEFIVQEDMQGTKQYNMFRREQRIPHSLLGLSTSLITQIHSQHQKPNLLYLNHDFQTPFQTFCIIETFGACIA